MPTFERIMKKDNDSIPEILSSGYVEYLFKKQNDVESCEAKTLLEHQKSIISKYDL